MERKAATQLSRLILFWFVILYAGTGTSVASAWLWNNPVLVTINDQQHTMTDYRNWWDNWKEEGMAVPVSPDGFINWQLMAQEGIQMELDSDPAFQRKVTTFIKVRSLMILKAEEVDGKVAIDDEALWGVYKEKYIPRLQVRLFFFADAKQAGQQAAAVHAGSLTTEQLQKLGSEDGGSSMVETKWLRRPQLRGEWLSALAEAQPGQLRGPVSMEKGAVLFEVLDVDDGGKSDFSEVRKKMESELRSKQEGALTTQLVDRLKKKFALQIDENILAQISETSLTAEQKEKALVNSTKGEISAGSFYAMLVRERAFRRKYKFKEEDGEELKQRVLINMMAQTLISWEAEDRHYETVSPLRETVDFYRRHRLVREVENRLLKPVKTLTDSEVKEYYLANQERYSHPATVGVALVEGEEELMQMIEREVNQGRDFFEVVERHFPQGILIQQLPPSHYSPEIQAVLASLQKGDVSSPFKMLQDYGLLKVINYRQKTPVPFSRVKDEIKQLLLQEKSNRARNDFLDRLKEHSTIEVNENNWQKIRKELADKDD